ncbi:hypothetical protein B0H16DRAFT_995676 [Mycena metata]|uniref:Uncharacterized protein n=1 Tax=Mycena metata TaxID=1033252 RepID=A0AAD7IJD0_9AGAR|nr:hypothetical protein B0H16DRAFT_995676 [Mycena metata]
MLWPSDYPRPLRSTRFRPEPPAEYLLTEVVQSFFTSLTPPTTKLKYLHRGILSALHVCRILTSRQVFEFHAIKSSRNPCISWSLTAAWAASFCLGRTGHKVTVLESALRISEVGAGIQISPNLSRLLIRWVLGDDLPFVSRHKE